MPRLERIEWAAAVPLIGGMCFGARRALGSDCPAFIASYGEAFGFNDAWARRYFSGADYFEMSEEELPDLAGGVAVSLCPCAGLSQATCSAFGSETRNRQNQWMVRVADKVLEDSRPAVLVGENAPNLFTHAGRNVRKEFFSIAEDHGYSVSFLKTSTHLHGIPQKRPRSFYYLWRSETAPKIPTVTRSTPPLGDFLKGYGSADDEQDLGYFDADALMPRYLRDQMGDDWREAWGTGGPDASPPTMFCILLVSQRLYDFLRWCEDVSDDPESDAGYSLVRRFFSNMAEHRGILDCTYMVSHPEGLLRSMMWKTFPNTIHPVYDRCLTRRELARVMDIPEDFPVGELEDPNMMCQNVPGATAMDAVAIAGAFLSGLLEDSGSRVSWTSDFNRHTFAGEDKAWTDERSRLASFDEESREFTLTDEGEAER